MGPTTQAPGKRFLKYLFGVLLIVLSWGIIGNLPAAAAPDASAENNALLCHVPPAGPMWLWVDESAVEAHLEHGDYAWSDDAECGGQPYPSDDDDDCDDLSFPAYDDDHDCDDECDDLSVPADDDDHDCDEDDLHFMHLPVVKAR